MPCRASGPRAGGGAAAGARTDCLATATSLAQAAGDRGDWCSGGNCSQLVVRNNDGTPVVRYQTRGLTEGGLLVELLEPSSIHVVWRALNTGTVEAVDAAQQGLDAIATRTLAQLPPHQP